MTIQHCYKTLQLKENATDEEISLSYKRLAVLYHPDKNPANIEWANEAMKTLNVAYNTLKSHRFSMKSSVDMNDNGLAESQNGAAAADDLFRKKKVPAEDPHTELFINRFVRLRETAKDSLYRYFQYSLFSIPRRDHPQNKRIFSQIVLSLRKVYHQINTLADKTDDEELLNHFHVFNRMIFNFYKASECINLIDTYNDRYETTAYRLYLKGDEKLHYAEKEIFYDRHNRGFFKFDIIRPLIIESESFFSHVIANYTSSSWVVEAQIKFDYIKSLKEYLYLFFTEDR